MVCYKLSSIKIEVRMRGVANVETTEIELRAGGGLYRHAN